MSKFFKFAAVAVPAKYLLKRDKTIDQQDVFGEFSLEELQEMDMRGCPLSLEHMLQPKKVVPPTGSEPMSVEMDQAKSALLGRVVDQYFSDKGDLMAVCELEMAEGDSEEQRQLKESIAQLVEAKKYGVSLTHAFGHQPVAKGQATEVTKVPVELSLTADPLREGCSVLEAWTGDAPYPMAEKKSDVYTGATRSFINWDAVAHNRQKMTDFAKKIEDLERKIAETEKKAAEEKKRSETLEARVNQLAPLAEAHTKAERKAIEDQKQSFTSDYTKMREANLEAYKKILELPEDTSKAVLTADDREVFAGMVDKPAYDPTPMLDKIVGKILPQTTAAATSSTSGAPPVPTPEEEREVYNMIGDFMKTMRTDVMVNSRLAAINNRLISERATASASSAAAASRVSQQQPPPPHSTPAQKKQEPFSLGPSDFAALAENYRKQAAARASAGAIPE